MGGNLLHHFNLPPKRIDRHEYEALSQRLIEEVSKHYPGRCAVLESYRNKQDFGDIDCLIETHESVRLDKWIQERFGVKPYVNGKTYSFPIDGFQVDLSSVNPLYFDTSFFYFRGEAGNLEGRVFHKMGLKHSHKGLLYCIRDSLFNEEGNHVLEEFILTQDPNKICEIGGFNYEVRKNGFESKEEMFEYVYSSFYFDSDIFSFENLNHINRTRNRKRPVYGEFLTYIRNKEKKIYNFKSKDEYLKDTILQFPELGERIEFYRIDSKEKKEVKRKFNGELVMEWTGIKDGKKVGLYMKLFRKKYNFQKLLTMSFNEVKSSFFNEYESSYRYI